MISSVIFNCKTMKCLPPLLASFSSLQKGELLMGHKSLTEVIVTKKKGETKTLEIPVGGHLLLASLVTHKH